MASTKSFEYIDGSSVCTFSNLSHSLHFCQRCPGTCQFSHTGLVSSSIYGGMVNYYKESLINQSLRSLGVISKPGHGGTRALPWVATRKGAIRLATIMKVPTAMDAADVFVDVFDEVLAQVLRGQKMIQVSNPSSIAPDEEQLQQSRKPFCGWRQCWS